MDYMREQAEFCVSPIRWPELLVTAAPGRRSVRSSLRAGEGMMGGITPII